MPKKSSGLTPAQRSAFFRALQAASIELGHATPEEREDYRKTVMREETGKEHLAQLSRTKDFDACMRRFASDAGDFETASRFAIADDARKAAILRICCAQVLQLKGCVAGTTEAADYLAGIVEQARVPCGRDVRDSSFWMDCAPGNILALFQILDTHRRRPVAAAVAQKERCGTVSRPRRRGAWRTTPRPWRDSPCCQGASPSQRR